jgi:Na+-driven multidrug efflux pump
LFDRKDAFTDFAARAFPVISVLVFFDMLQLILAAALRGAANVRTVMLTRVCLGFGVFMPFSYILAQLPIANTLLKFILVYGSFYITNGIMSIVYIMRFKGHAWKEQSAVVAQKESNGRRHTKRNFKNS